MTNRITIPAGTYIIADPCYSVPETEVDGRSTWHGWLDFIDYSDPSGTVHGGTFNGYTAYAASTAFGDGYYTDQNDISYGVDAGLIGVVLATDETLAVFNDGGFTGGQIKTFSEDFEMYVEDPSSGWEDSAKHVIVIGDIRIETGDLFDEDDEEDEDWND